MVFQAESVAGLVKSAAPQHQKLQSWKFGVTLFFRQIAQIFYIYMLYNNNN